MLLSPAGKWIHDRCVGSVQRPRRNDQRLGVLMPQRIRCRLNARNFLNSSPRILILDFRVSYYPCDAGLVIDPLNKRSDVVACRIENDLGQTLASKSAQNRSSQ